MRYEKHLPTYHQRRNQYEKSWVRPTLSPSSPSYHLDESLQRGVGLFFDEGRGGRSCKARRGLVLR